MITITHHDEWVYELLEFLKPYQDRIIQSQIFVDVAHKRLSKDVSRAAAVYFYPLIESFPQYLALNLAKVPGGNSERNVNARDWFIANITQERLHGRWWKTMARRFGVPDDTFYHEIIPPPEIDAINNYLWRICTYGSLAESVSAANFAIEGVTGQWTKLVRDAFRKHPYIEEIPLDDQGLEWITVHASYDDKHPLEALEIIKAFALTGDDREKVQQAAKRALEYYALALEKCYELRLSKTA